jgi:hypothetical protein
MTVLVRVCLIAALLATASANEESAMGDATVIVTANGQIQKQVDETLSSIDNATTAEEEQAVQGPGAAFGVVQAISTDEVTEETYAFDESDVLALLEETAKYMTEIVHKEESYADVRDVCFNLHEMCTIWATQGECEKNEDYMLEECAPACQACDQIKFHCEEDFGVCQVLDRSDISEENQHLFDEASVKQLVAETKAYMELANMSADDEEESDCYNNDALCTFWATRGECQMNPDFMLAKCAPACKSCDFDIELEQEGPGSDYGRVQITDPTKTRESDVDVAAVLQKLQDVNEYMTADLQQDPGCANYYAMCTIWAAGGKCEKDSEFMIEEVSSTRQTNCC